MTKKEFKELVDGANRCLKYNECEHCDKFASQGSDCFICNEILNFKNMLDPIETVRMAQIISDIGKLFEEKDKEKDEYIEKLEKRLSIAKNTICNDLYYVYEDYLKNEDRFTEIIGILQRGELPPLSFNTD